MKALILIPLLVATTAAAETVQLQFDPSPDKDVEYYTLFQSKRSDLSASVATDLGLNTSPTVSVDGIGKEYFAVTATDKSGNVSEKSNTLEVKDTRPPTAPKSLRLFGAK